MAGIQTQPAHWQEEETGQERSRDWPQVTQPAVEAAGLASGSSGWGLLSLGWSLGVSSISGKFSGSPQHFADTDALKTDVMLRLGHLWSPAAPHSTPGGGRWDPFFRGCPCDHHLLFVSEATWGRGEAPGLGARQSGVGCWLCPSLTRLLHLSNGVMKITPTLQGCYKDSVI